ncbi:hypothetical protein [Mycobacterium sp.]|uniref:hypothetical protein n=1 Tax=Mycobacterium sp. TaxID=1785 RepID=UPI003F9BF8FB
MGKFPKNLADAEVVETDLDQDDFQFEGERLTEGRAAKLAEEKWEKTANLVPGGKSLSGGQQHSPVVQVRVSVTTKAKLEAVAKERKVSVSKLSRQVLDHFVENLYRPLVWRGQRTERDGRYHQYAISDDNENEYLVLVTGDSVDLRVRQLGEWRNDLFASFPRGDNLSRAVQLAQAHAEVVNRQLWTSQPVQR